MQSLIHLLLMQTLMLLLFSFPKSLLNHILLLPHDWQYMLILFITSDSSLLMLLSPDLISNRVTQYTSHPLSYDRSRIDNDDPAVDGILVQAIATTPATTAADSGSITAAVRLDTGRLTTAGITFFIFIRVD